MSLFNKDLEPVAPSKPVAAWVGGKKQLSKRLCTLIDSIAHECYVEPFIGMGGVFLRRENRPKSEVINDINGDVVNLFRLLQRHYQSLIDELKYTLAGRREFERLLSLDPSTLTDIERAARFIYLQRLAFGGTVVGQSYGVDPYKSARYNISTLEPMLADIHDRLSGVVIENLDWSKVIKVYDRPEVLFFLDPPYYNSEDYYGKNLFSKGDYKKLADQLSNIEGKFIMTLNDIEPVRETFEKFNIESVELTYTLSVKSPKTVSEVIITNDAARQSKVF